LRDRLLIAVFVTALTAPFVAFLAGVGVTGSAYESDRLHARPHVTGIRHLPRFAGDWLDYFSDHFGSREALIHAHAVFSMRVLNVSPSSTVIAGRDGWLYYADDSALEDYQSAQPLGADDLEAWRTSLVATRDALRTMGTSFVFMIAPDKHVIYPGHLPASLHRLGTTYRAEQLVAYLREHTDLTIVDPRAALLQQGASERVYALTDTHWNDRGAYVAYDAVLRAAGISPQPRRAFAATEQLTEGGDLASMLGLEHVLHEPRLGLDPLAPRRARIIDPPTLNEGFEVARVVTTIDDPTLPRVVVFRDSFMSQMIPFLSEHFSRAVYLWQNDVDLDLVRQEQPGLVIFEIVGRRLQTYVP
jgi:alginate O-acetyltransferase complex protein AlgJ